LATAGEHSPQHESGAALFATTERRRDLELRAVRQLGDGRLSLVYGVG